jgi:long-chain acyl-CoA synthetase
MGAPRSTPAALAPDVGRVLARLARHVETSLATLDLSLPQYRVLGFLSAGEAASSRLAEKLAVSPPSITAVVDGLVAKGLVERRSDPNDRRRLPLALTEKGAVALVHADAAVHDRVELVLTQLDDDGAAAVRGSISHWLLALDRSRDANHAGRTSR